MRGRWTTLIIGGLVTIGLSVPAFSQAPAQTPDRLKNRGATQVKAGNKLENKGTPRSGQKLKNKGIKNKKRGKHLKRKGARLQKKGQKIENKSQD